MNCLANESLNYLKISPFSSSACRLLSSVTNSRNPLFISSKDSTSPTPFNPFQFFNDQTNSRLCTLGTTKILQAHLLRRYLLPFDVYLTKSLLSWYSKSGSMVDAAKLFDTMPQPDVVSCNMMISGYKQNKLFEESWRFFSKMHFLGFEANEVSYVSVLSACSALQVPLFSELVCCHTIKMGFSFYEVVQSALIDSFSKSLRFQDAYEMFRDNLSSNNVYCWNTIIAGALRNQDYGAVFELFYEMCGGFQKPDSYTHSSVLAACASLEKLRFGKAVQARAIKCGAEDVFVCTAIVDLYAKCGHMAEAREVFSRIPNPTGVSWTVMLSSCTKSNDAFSALEIFKEMRRSGVEINSFTVTSVIAACGRPSMVREASQIHAWVLKSGFYLDSSVAASLISMYSKSEDIDLSELVFEDLDDIQKLSIVNVMVSSFSQNKKPGKAIRLFTRMLRDSLRPDEFSVCSLLSVLYCLNLGKQIHSYTLKSGLVLDITVGSSLFTMYSKCGSLEESFCIFKEIPVKDNACWASMISGFNEYGYLREAIGLFREMLADGTSPDESTLAAVLTVCASLPSLPRGKEIHGYALRAGIDKGMPLGSALVNTYSKCGSLKLARRVYDRLPEMDPVSCSSLISGYSQHGLIQDGFLLFRDMVVSGFNMDSFAVSSILKAAVLTDESSLGAQVHAYITKIGLCTEPSVGSSLLTVYSKFGSIEDCFKAFSQINGPDLIAWTALIASYAQHGKATEALQVYNLMKEKGLKPDKVTLVGVLSACSHGGLVEEGYSHLNSMVKEYGIEPDNRHYACMVDALGRSGRLREAENFINNMPIKADALVWGTLLAACRVYEDVELGKLAAKKAIELEPSDAGAYVSLSNILAEVGEWEEVEETRKLMKGTGVQKKPGWSFV